MFFEALAREIAQGAFAISEPSENRRRRIDDHRLNGVAIGTAGVRHQGTGSDTGSRNQHDSEFPPPVNAAVPAGIIAKIPANGVHGGNVADCRVIGIEILADSGDGVLIVVLFTQTALVPLTVGAR